MSDRSPDDSVIWLRQLVCGDEDVFREFLQRYGARLERLAEQRMAPRLLQRGGLTSKRTVAARKNVISTA